MLKYIQREIAERLVGIREQYSKITLRIKEGLAFPKVNSFIEWKLRRTVKWQLIRIQ